MEHADDNAAVPQPHVRSGESSSGESTPSASSLVPEGLDGDHNHDRPPEPFPEHSTAFLNPLQSFTAWNNEGLSQTSHNIWSCIIFVLNFSLLEFVDYENLGPKLYGFYGDPSLNVATIWSETHSTSLLANTHKEWVYFLNEGSQINVSYSVKSKSSSSLILIIAQGTGMIQQNILKASGYHVAVGNLNAEKVEVQLNLRMRAYLYNTTEAYYECTLAHGQCSLKLFFPKGNSAVLTSPGLTEGATAGEWYVKLSYGPRWITYIIGIGAITILTLMAIHFLNNFRCPFNVEHIAQSGELSSERVPLLFHKDDDASSWGSSYDSISQDDEDLQEGLTSCSLEGKPLRDGECSSDIRRLCATCLDAPRDCFFLACGHCIACFACGKGIAEAAGTCPICHRKMKKVRRVFTV